MVTINGYTAQHMQDIEDNTIVDANLVNYELVFTKHDNTTINLGNVRGATGATGPQGIQGAAGSSGYVICTSTTRPSSPIIGMSIYETDTGKHLVYYGTTTTWQPPWNQPWGLVSYAADTVGTSSSSTTYVDLGGCTWTGTTLANRYYRATLSGRVQSNGTAGIANVALRNAANTELQHRAVTTTNALYQPVPFTFSYTWTTTNTLTTVKASHRADSGTSILIVAFAGAPATLHIEDLGSAGNPPAS